MQNMKVVKPPVRVITRQTYNHMDILHKLAILDEVKEGRWKIIDEGAI